MYKILIANYSPEFNDGRVQRVSSLCQLFDKRGINYSVISFGSKKLNTQNSIKLDSIVLKVLNPVDRVARKTSIKHNRTKLRNIVSSLRAFIRPDPYIIDVLINLRKLSKLIEKKDVVIISVPWFSLMAFLLTIRAKYVILDFRDLYLGNPIFSKPNSKFDTLFLSWALRRVDEVWVTTERAFEEISRVCTVKTTVVSNGISYKDAVKISSLNLTGNRHSVSDKIRIGYFGNLGGSRDFTQFFRKLDNIHGVELFGAGNFDTPHQDIFGKKYLGMLEKDNLYEFMSRTDVVIVCIRHEEHAEFAIPAKIFEAMCFGMPILLVCPNNAAAKSLLDLHDYPHCHCEDESQLSLDTIVECSKKVAKPTVIDRDSIFSNALNLDKANE